VYLMCVCSVHRCIGVEKKNQLDVTECFIALMVCSTRFGHFYAHHQELETMGDAARRAASFFLDAQPAALHLTPNNQQTNTAHHRH